eukprot:354619-Chlamydomonas_euryale.AAC.13
MVATPSQPPSASARAVSSSGTCLTWAAGASAGAVSSSGTCLTWAASRLVVSGKPGRVLLLPPGHGGATGVAGPLAFSPQGSAAPMAALPTQPIVELETAYGSSLPNHWFLLPACATGAAVKQWYKAQQRVRHNSEGSADSCGTGAVQCGEMGELEIEAAAMYPSLWAGTNFAACSSVGAGELTAKLAACAAAAASVRDNQPAAQQLLSRWIHTPQSGRL